MNFGNYNPFVVILYVWHIIIFQLSNKWEIVVFSVPEFLTLGLLTQRLCAKSLLASSPNCKFLATCLVTLVGLSQLAALVYDLILTWRPRMAVRYRTVITYVLRRFIHTVLGFQFWSLPHLPMFFVPGKCYKTWLFYYFFTRLYKWALKLPFP